MGAFDDDTREIVDAINAMAPSLAPELLPNGRKAGNKWMFSGIDDHGKSESAWLHLSGPKIGHWTDAGNAAAGEERGDLLDLIRILRCGGDSKAAFDEARAILGKESRWVPGSQLSQEERQARAEAARRRAEEREEAEAAERDKKAKRARALYLGAAAMAGTPAEAYFQGRGLRRIAGPDGQLLPWPGSLKYHGEVWHGALQCKRPAMVACIMDAAGVQIGAHRIFLQHHKLTGWGKLKGAPDVPAKMVLGNMHGGFVPLHKGRTGVSMGKMAEGEAVYVTEGIEDGWVVAMAKPEARVIAAISLGNIGQIVLPEAARKIVVVADRDDNMKARDALERSIAQQQARGLDVSLVMPPPGIKDLNEWLLADSSKVDA